MSKKQSASKKRFSLKKTINYKGNTNFMGKVHSRVIEKTYTVYLVSSGAGQTGYYSFTAGAAQFALNALIGAMGQEEFKDLVKDFQLFRVRGTRITARSVANQNTAGIFQSAPTLCATATVSTTGLQKEWACSDQNAVKINPTNAAVASRYYRFPECIVGSNGYPQCGSTIWFNSGVISEATTAMLLWVIIGNENYAQCSGAGSAVIAELTVEIFMDFAKSMKCRT